MSNSTNLTLPFLTLGQAQKHVTVNESLLRLDALVQLNVVSATTSAQPGSPSDGAVYILPSGKTGADWATMSNYALAYYRGGIWEQIAPREGWLAYVKDADQLVFYTGSAGSLFAPGKLISVSATDKVLGRVTAGVGAAEEVTFTDQAQALCDDASFGAMRTTMGAAGLADANTFTQNNRIDASLGIGVDPGVALDIFGATANSSRINISRTSGSAVIFAIAGGGGGFAGVGGPFQIYTNAGSGDNLQAQFGHSTQGMILGAPTGSFKGVGTLNAMAVYGENTLLTCFVLEYARTGALDLDFWDSVAPRGRHDAAHRFWGQRELLDVDAYTAFWKENGHLPGLPSRAEWAEHARDKKPVGEMISRLWQTVEMQAVHIAALRENIVALTERLA